MFLTGSNMIIFCIGAAIVSLLFSRVYHLLLAEGGNKTVVRSGTVCLWEGHSCGFNEQSWELFLRGYFEIFDMMTMVMGGSVYVRDYHLTAYP